MSAAIADAQCRCGASFVSQIGETEGNSPRRKRNAQSSSPHGH